MADGSFRMAKKYGAPELSMSVKKLELPAYDPRGMQGQGLYLQPEIGEPVTKQEICWDQKC